MLSELDTRLTEKKREKYGKEQNCVLIWDIQGKNIVFSIETRDSQSNRKTIEMRKNCLKRMR